jgi:hypothetical protein
LHPQGCQILSLDPLLFGLNHMPVDWHSRQESHLQHPRSKRGALIIELREQRFEEGAQKAEIPLNDDAQQISQLFFNLPFLPLKACLKTMKGHPK